MPDEFKILRLTRDQVIELDEAICERMNFLAECQRDYQKRNGPEADAGYSQEITSLGELRQQLKSAPYQSNPESNQKKG